MARYIEVKDASPIMSQDKEAVQHAECDSRYREEVHGGDRLAMIA
jgi:hypothetical protein